MSQFQLNPMNILDNSPMGGFRAGLADQRALLHSDSALGFEAQQTEKLGLDNETTRLNRPLDAAKRAKDIADAELQQRLIDDGTTESGMRADVDRKIAEAASQMDENQRKRVKDQTDAIIRANEFLKDKDEAFVAANWGDVADEMHRFGIKTFPKQYNYAAYQKLQAAGQAAWHTAAVLARRDEQKVGHGYDMAKQADHQEFLARQQSSQFAHQSGENALNRSNQREVAILNHPPRDPREANGLTAERATADLREAIRTGDYSNITEFDIALVEQNVLAKRDPQIQKDFVLTIGNLQRIAKTSKNPKAREEAIEQIKIERREALGPISALLDQARAKISGTTESPTSKGVTPDAKEAPKVGDNWNGKKVVKLAKRKSTGKLVVIFDDGTNEETPFPFQ